MPNPTIPNGFKPLIDEYSGGAPTGVFNTEVAGGLPRAGLMWDRGPRQYSVAMVLSPEKFSVWAVFLARILDGGAISFYMPIDSGAGLEDHLCTMVAGSYAERRAERSVFTRISFSVLAEPSAYEYSKEEAQDLIDLWNSAGEQSDDLLRRIAQFANVDTNVLDFD
ncbi:hypothetical protein D9M68_857640 [compost metagenome]